MKEKFVIFGAGGFAREVAWLVESCQSETYHPYVACFVDNISNDSVYSLNDIPVFSADKAYQKYPDAFALGGVGSPKLREKLMKEAESYGFQFKSLIHPTVRQSQWNTIGVGAIICAGNILTTNINLGNYVQLNLGCTIGHDAILEDYSTLAPGVHISGHVHLGKRVYIGSGAVVINGQKDKPLTIGDDAIIGAGACVTKSIPSGKTAVGVPARMIN